MIEELENGEYIPVQAENCIILKSIMCGGIWGCKPRENGVAHVAITNVSCSGVTLQNLNEPNISLFLSQSFDGTWCIGNADSVIDKILELCIQSMLVRENSKFIIKLASITNHKPQECNIYPIIIYCSIHLEKLTNDKPIHTWSEDKVFHMAMHHKIEGVKLFKNGRRVEAFLKFSKSFKYLNLINIKLANERDLTNVLLLRVALLNNMANCHLYFQNYVFTTELCNKALSIDPNNVKSLYRRAIANMNMQKFEEAKNDFNKILQIEPSNTTAKDKYQELKEVMKERDANYAAVIKKMFSN